MVNSVEPVEQLNQVRQLASPLLNPVTVHSEPNRAANPMAQITSVTQLSDVQPTDWAYQALQSLVERYGCIVGYPDSTYRGQRALTRFEFAAGVNACLDRISELLAASTTDLATKEDVATLQRLQEEFAAELAALRGRVDVLESRTAELEANQFSTTTKLNGDSFFVVADVFGDDVGDANETVFQYRYRLTFDTSFNGRDLLRARLQAGNVLSFNQPGNEATLAANTNTNGEVRLDDLGYAFPIGDRVTGLVVANAVALDRLVFGNTINPFDVGAPRGAVSRFGQRQPIYRFGGLNTGIGFNFQFTKELSAQIGYGAGESSNPTPGSGLFNGDYNVIGQLTARNLFDRLDLALTYVNTYLGTSSSSTGITAGLRTGTGSLAAAVDADRPVIANSYGIQANFRIAKGFQLGGWAGFSAVRAIDLGDADVWNYAVTLAFPDLGGRGNLGGVLVGMQPRLTGTTPGLGSALDLRRDPDVGLHVEAFYRLALNDNIDITPGVVWLTAPNHDADNADIILGVLRTTFRF
ncbi:MAG: iron uptake porin [Nodosilinea sp.]